MSNKLPGRAGPFCGRQQYKTRSLSWNSLFGNAACTSAVSNVQFCRPLLALKASRTPMASRQAVGESLRMSNTLKSAYPGTTIRADCLRVQKILSKCFCLRFCPRQQTVTASHDLANLVSTVFARWLGFRRRYYRCCCVFLREMAIQAMPLLLFGSSGFCEKCIVQQLRHIDACPFWASTPFLPPVP